MVGLKSTHLTRIKSSLIFMTRTAPESKTRLYRINPTHVNSSAYDYNSSQCDLRKYLQQNHNQLTWKQRINIIGSIIIAVLHLHYENSIHRDLHSGNILYSEYTGRWYISDFGFCGPADKPLGSIYGNLPYISPEVINGTGYTFASDIYIMKIMNGMRPNIVNGTPLEYANLMVQCWDADPSKRHDIKNLKGAYKQKNISDSNITPGRVESSIFRYKGLNSSSTTNKSSYTSGSFNFVKSSFSQ
ncbi:12741_t:CDS:2 [Funneliformis geosporum]|uniref:12741_t:CDS:1 n=1 Tax=Funneliformis geosporum TaxID=1117311 RepID=A0A9W4X3I7_9GLOM|nr:12741_t:CDS:2 [Funneliformis geosporum]